MCVAVIELIWNAVTNWWGKYDLKTKSTVMEILI